MTDRQREYRERRVQLELEIKDAVKRFETDTDLTVTSIDVHRIVTMNSVGTLLACECRVELARAHNA